MLCMSLNGLAQFADQDHPRLWLRKSGEAEIQQKIESDPLAAKLHQATLAEADEILDLPTCRYDIPDGRRLLRESRYALNNLMHCSYAWRFTSEEKYLKRAVAELTAACSLKNWNPLHFLDVAEMATAVAIGYDWLYDDLQPAERAMCEKALRDKALRPATRLHKEGVWWSDGRNNWGQVCGSGIALAAIAIQGKDEGLSEPLITKGLDVLVKCEHFYTPDGLYPEGPGYWHYGTNYHVMLLAACKALGYSAHIPPLLEQSGKSMMHLHSPQRVPFNFSDGHAKVSGKSPAQAWIAQHFESPAQANDVRHVLTQALDKNSELKINYRSSPLSILWLPEKVEDNTSLPTHAIFHGEQSVAVFRSRWTPDAEWLAIKGGTPYGGHGHMDVGSFCYDAHRTRWFHDLGSDDYNMPGYFRDKRFSYYRLQNRSHNTLEIGGDLQEPNTDPCPIISSDLESQPASATFDLTGAYANSAKKVTRTASFDSRNGSARIQDTIEAPKGEVIWRVLTDAECEIVGDTVTLRKDDKSITLKRHSKQGSWSIHQAIPPQKIENVNEGFREVRLTVPQKDRIAIDVEISP